MRPRASGATLSVSQGEIKPHHLTRWFFVKEFPEDKGCVKPLSQYHQVRHSRCMLRPCVLEFVPHSAKCDTNSRTHGRSIHRECLTW